MSRYHRFRWRDDIDIVVMEVRAGHFVWLSFYLSPSLRKNCIADEFILFVLQKLRGTHHIHPLRQVRTFYRVAKRYNWDRLGPSKFFLGCTAFRTRGKGITTKMFPLFDKLLHHNRQKKLPKLRTFASVEHAKDAVALISAHFN